MNLEYFASIVAGSTNPFAPTILTFSSFVGETGKLDFPLRQGAIGQRDGILDETGLRLLAARRQAAGR